jgi:exopolyphosphatase/guanosine-5'-triphosphate,3'-diphosphate pyrophosphatase
LLYDLLGRRQKEDARERTVRAMTSRYQVDDAQANRVANTAATLLEQCRDSWGLQSELAKNMLDWSARLHEVGLDISHDGFQRHGAYVAQHADMPGFPRAEQRFLAFLIGSQRHAIDMQFLRQLPRGWRERALRLVILLRLAVLLNRSRREVVVPPIEVNAKAASMQLLFDASWLELNPLTVADLSREEKYLRSVGYELNYG